MGLGQAGPGASAGKGKGALLGERKLPSRYSDCEEIASGDYWVCGRGSRFIRSLGDDGRNITQVPSMKSSRQMAAGSWHACALGEEGVQ